MEYKVTKINILKPLNLELIILDISHFARYHHTKAPDNFLNGGFAKLFM